MAIKRFRAKTLRISRLADPEALKRHLLAIDPTLKDCIQGDSPFTCCHLLLGVVPKGMSYGRIDRLIRAFHGDSPLPLPYMPVQENWGEDDLRAWLSFFGLEFRKGDTSPPVTGKSFLDGDLKACMPERYELDINVGVCEVKPRQATNIIFEPRYYSIKNAMLRTLNIPESATDNDAYMNLLELWRIPFSHAPPSEDLEKSFRLAISGMLSDEAAFRDLVEAADDEEPLVYTPEFIAGIAGYNAVFKIKPRGVRLEEFRGFMIYLDDLRYPPYVGTMLNILAGDSEYYHHTSIYFALDESLTRDDLLYILENDLGFKDLNIPEGTTGLSLLEETFQYNISAYHYLAFWVYINLRRNSFAKHLELNQYYLKHLLTLRPSLNLELSFQEIATQLMPQLPTPRKG